MDKGAPRRMIECPHCSMFVSTTADRCDSCRWQVSAAARGAVGVEAPTNPHRASPAASSPAASSPATSTRSYAVVLAIVLGVSVLVIWSYYNDQTRRAGVSSYEPSSSDEPTRPYVAPAVYVSPDAITSETFEPESVLPAELRRPLTELTSEELRSREKLETDYVREYNREHQNLPAPTVRTPSTTEPSYQELRDQNEQLKRDLDEAKANEDD
jgi:hypothetical protein